MPIAVAKLVERSSHRQISRSFTYTRGDIQRQCQGTHDCDMIRISNRVVWAKQNQLHSINGWLSRILSGGRQPRRYSSRFARLHLHRSDALRRAAVVSTRGLCELITVDGLITGATRGKTITYINRDVKNCPPFFLPRFFL